MIQTKCGLDGVSVWLLILLPIATVLGGCSTVPVRNSLIGVGATTLVGHLPTSSIAQVYYLGVFDPRDQLPPTIYRIRVQGQASAINTTNFASGWVRAELVDSLSGKVELPGEQSADGSGAGGAHVEEVDKGLLTGRRLVMFGPEGFREAPKNHRLVVVMGSSPEKFFQAVDQALGVVASVTQGANAGPDIERGLWKDLSQTRVLKQKVDDLLNGLQTEYLPGSGS